MVNVTISCSVLSIKYQEYFERRMLFNFFNLVWMSNDFWSIMWFQRLYIDGKDHLLGKLASYVAKALLQGNRVVVFNCDKINIAGSFYRSVFSFKSLSVNAECSQVLVDGYENAHVVFITGTRSSIYRFYARDVTWILLVVHIIFVPLDAFSAVA